MHLQCCDVVNINYRPALTESKKLEQSFDCSWVVVSRGQIMTSPCRDWGLGGGFAWPDRN